MEQELETRLIDMETRLAFMEATIDELNKVTARQQAELDELLGRFKELAAQAAETLVDKDQPAKPPHY
jgi:SlyX protein